MPHPPWNDVWEMTYQLLAPGLGAALLVMLAVRLVGRERLSPLAAALAFIVGMVCGTQFREPFTWKLDSERDLSVRDLRLALAQSLEPQPDKELKEGEEPPPPRQSPRYWLLWVTALAVIVELVARGPKIPIEVSWIARTAVAMFAGRLLTYADLRTEMTWSSWALGLVILAEWAVLTLPTRETKDGAPAVSLAVCALCAAVITLYAGSGSLVDWALLPFGALIAVATVAWIWKSDTGPALAGMAVFLPGLMLNVQQETASKLTWHPFALTALAPLGLVVLLIPDCQRLVAWRRALVGIGAVLIPGVAAISLAVRDERLPFTSVAYASGSSTTVILSLRSESETDGQ